MSHFKNFDVIYSVKEIKKLVEEAQKGGDSSFTKLYNAFFTPVYRYVFSRVNDKDIADDLVQIIFIRWYKALPGYELQVSPLQYLFIIARRLLIDKYKEVDVFSLDEESYIEIQDPSMLHDEVLNTKITTEHILGEFKNLSILHQEVLRLHFFAELTTEEIATLLNKKEPAIRQIKHRALTALRELTKRFNENY